jgi:tetratricopeptide (TPR) repeat protein
VGVGHELLALSIPAEFEEISTIYQISQNKKLGRDELVPALNWMPDRCFSPGADGTVGVHVIGWGLWSGFFQRQFCHAIEHDFDFLERKWGVPDDAKSFSDKCDARFGDLRLYPFVRRLSAVDSETYHKSVDDGFKVTVATPQLVPAESWDELDYWLNPNDYYHPNPNPHINEWHKHNPPPGTAYNPLPRMDHPSLVWRPDSTALLDKLHEMAPYDNNISWYIWKTKYKENPTYDQALALFKPTLPFSVYAMRKVANTVLNQPDLYEILLSKSATIEPSDYFTLADYFVDRKQDGKAAQYFEKGAKMDPDPLSLAAHANWLIHYYLRNGRTQEARQLADFAGEVYSDDGLLAKADYLETVGDYTGAYQWYSKIGERYDDYTDVIAYTIRHKAKTGDTQFDALVQDQLTKVFPNGVEKAGLANFQSPPADGVLIKQATDRTHAAGMKAGDVIVAINGVRTYTFNQYICGLKVDTGPEMDLIVWQGNRYSEIKTSPPGHHFGGKFVDYSARQ